MNTLKEAKLTASARHIERFSKSGVPISNSEVLDTAGRKTRRRRRRKRQAITPRHAFHANTITTLYEGNLSILESVGLMHG